MRSRFGKLNVECLESRDNPSGLSEFWDSVNYYGRAALEGLGEGLTNIGTGAYDAVVELGRTGRDLVTIYSDWDNVDPSRLESKLFQGAAQTASNPQAAAAFDNHLVFGIVTLGVGPLAESGYNAVITGDSTQFSQQAGGFGVMVLVPYAGVRGINALPTVPVRVPVPQPGMVLQTVDGALVTVPGGVAWETVVVVSFAVPAEASTAITVVAMSASGPGSGGINQQTPDAIRRSIKSLEQQVVEHKQKLDEYIKDPEAFDNKGFLKNAPSPEIRQKIIDGRVKHLQGEIDNFLKQIEALKGLLGGG